jgi:hypothetical protein
MFIWSSKDIVMDLGETETRYCPACEKERSFHIILSYTFTHLYYLFGVVSNKQYIHECEICHLGNELNRRLFEGGLEKSPISFIHRFGWLVGILGFFGVFLALGILEEFFAL